MTQFHEGQEVEVALGKRRWDDGKYWRKAKIVCPAFPADKHGPEMFDVEFPDGTVAVFDADHIRVAL
jgi:hypothetical protein